MRFGLLEAIIIFAIILLFFGTKLIPGLTKTILNAKKEIKEDLEASKLAETKSEDKE